MNHSRIRDIYIFIYKHAKKWREKDDGNQLQTRERARLIATAEKAKGSAGREEYLVESLIKSASGVNCPRRGVASGRRPGPMAP